MKQLITLLLTLVVSVANSQTTSANLFTNPTFVGTTGWTTTGAVGGNGPTHPAAPANGNGYTFTFSQGTIAQTYAINQALAQAGVGVQVAGFDYGFKYRFGCANQIGGYCENPAGIQDTLNATSTITSNTGATVYTRYYALGSNAPAPYSTTFSSVDTQQRFNSAVPVQNLGNFGISFTGQDNGYWGGNYGPTIKDVYSRAVYTVDPCMANPASSPSCPGYATNVITSSSLLSGTTGVQSYAINQALALSGSGVMIHGFNYGYNYNVGGTQCTATNQDGSCSWWMAGTASVTTTIKDHNAGTIYNQTDSYTGPTSGTKNTTYLFPTSRSLDTLSTFRMAPGVSGNSSITGMYSRAIYTPDWCAQNPLYDPSCPGYNDVLTSQNITAQTYAINQALNLSGAGVKINGVNYGYHYYVGGDWCSAMVDGACVISSSSMDIDVGITSNTGSELYNATHSHTQQNAGGTPSYSYRFPAHRPLSAMGNFSLTTREVGATALYSAWSNWQYTPDPCVVNPLSSTTCAGYQTAYFEQQCTANALYAVTCPGYQTAYFDQQCTANALYNASCPGYATAFKAQQCTANPLYATDCPGYAEAYKTQQCAISALYATDCPGYAEAYKTQQCTISALYATDCPGYAVAYKAQQCTANPLYATDCPGYEQAYLNSQCIIDSLYSRLCTGYATAYAIKYLVPLDSTTSSAVNSSLSTTAAVKAMDPGSVNTTGTVNTTPSATGDSTVDAVISAPSTTSATSVNSVVNAPPPPPGAGPSPTANATAQASAPPPPPPPAVQQERAAENKKTEGAVASVERRAGGDREAAKKEATAQAKELANNMAKATTLEAQTASQGLVVGLIGFVPGFSAYQNAIIPDALGAAVSRQYSKPTVDNRSAQRQLSGSNEYRWREMVDSQYNRGK